MLNEQFRKSSKSGGNGQCAEVALIDGRVVIRNSKDPDGSDRPMVRFTPEEWEAFIGGAKEGEFDL